MDEIKNQLSPVAPGKKSPKPTEIGLSSKVDREKDFSDSSGTPATHGSAISPGAPELSLKTQNYKRYITSGLAFALGSTAGVAYLRPSYEAADGDHTLGVFFAIGTLLVFALDSSWAWYHVIQSANEARYTKQKINIKDVAKVGLATIFTVGASCFSFYVVSRYNNSIFYPILMLVNNFGLNLYGYIKLLYPKSLKQSGAPEEKYYFDKKYVSILQLLVLIFPAGNFVINSVLSYKAAQEVNKNIFLALFFIALTVPPTAALEVLAARNLVKRPCIQDEKLLMLTKKERGLRLVLQFIALPVIALSASSRAYITADNFNEFILKYIMVGLSIGSGVLFEQFVAVDVIDLGIFYSKKYSRIADSDERAHLSINAP